MLMEPARCERMGEGERLSKVVAELSAGLACLLLLLRLLLVLVMTSELSFECVDGL